MACCTPHPDVAQKKSRLPEKEYFQYPGSGPWFKCEPDAEVAPRIAEAGVAGPDTAPTIMPLLLEMAVKKQGGKDAMLVERPLPPLKDGQAPPAFPREKWTKWTWKSYRDEVRSMAKTFLKLGFKQFDTVNIWGFNAPEWTMSAMAAMYAGGKSGGIYPTDTPDTAAYKVVHSGGAIITVEGRAQFDKLVGALNERKDAKHVKAFISWLDVPAEGETTKIEGCGEMPFLSWKAALGLGKDMDDTALNMDAIKPGHCCAIIYTSGTTGEPKGVMASHDNLQFSSKAVVSEMSCTGFGLAGEERGLSYLPLSHIAGLCIDIAGPMSMTARNAGWTAIFFARPYDLKVGAIGNRLTAVRPTVFFGVPLVWEKMADRIRMIGAATTGLKKTVSTWAKGKALSHAMQREIGKDGAVPNMYCLAAKILNALKGAVGLDQCKIAATGAAPMNPATMEYFASLGIDICEGYGMSESVLGATFSTPVAHQWGSCGYELSGWELKIFKVDPTDLNKKAECPPAPELSSTDEQFMGEICFRGRGIMMGYLACKDMGPDHLAEMQKKTGETIDSEGWLHSGDKGMRTTLGMVRITGRYKELIIGEGGENIAPVPIEDSVKNFCNGINEVMMIGDQRKYNVAVITLKAVGANGEVPGTDNLDAGAKLVNPAVTTISAAIKDQVWIQAITDAITQTNSNQKIVLNNAFKIQKFTILPQNFSEEMGQLTPTKKLKRKTVETQYIKMIDKIYAEAGSKDFKGGLYVPYEQF